MARRFGSRRATFPVSDRENRCVRFLIVNGQHFHSSNLRIQESDSFYQRDMVIPQRFEPSCICSSVNRARLVTVPILKKSHKLGRLRLMPRSANETLQFRQLAYFGLHADGLVTMMALPPRFISVFLWSRLGWLRLFSPVSAAGRVSCP